MYEDFQEETIRDYENGKLYGLEKFWAFLKYDKHVNVLTVNPTLKKYLSKFKTIEDFRVEEASSAGQNAEGAVASKEFQQRTNDFLPNHGKSYRQKLRNRTLSESQIASVPNTSRENSRRSSTSKEKYWMSLSFFFG